MLVAFFRLLSKLPLSWLHGLGDFLYFLLAYVVRYRRSVILRNLENAFPEKTPAERETIARAFYRNFSDLIVETIKLPRLSASDLHRHSRLLNPELVKPYLEQGQPVIVMASHLANWEWAPGVLALNGIPVDSIYKPLANETIDRIVQHIRSSFGARPVPMHRLLRDMAERKNVPRVIGLLADQVPDSPEQAYWTDFMHQDTPFYPGSERLARRNKLPVFFIEFARIRRGYYELTFHPIAIPPYDGLPEGELMNRYRDLLEASIRRAPSDWLWSHKRWKHHRGKWEKIQTKLEG